MNSGGFWQPERLGVPLLTKQTGVFTRVWPRPSSAANATATEDSVMDS